MLTVTYGTTHNISELFVGFFYLLGFYLPGSSAVFLPWQCDMIMHMTWPCFRKESDGAVPLEQRNAELVRHRDGLAEAALA